ncbi:MAG TPA: ion transporter [Cyclobacteriaceae bacterium]|nr:ion transporter [Cyclobacteriaceae bacterium]
MKQLKLLVNGPAFHRLTSIAIILCSITLGIETFYPEHQLIFDFFDIVFTGYFLWEILMRILAEGNPIRFFSLMTWKRKQSGNMGLVVSEDGFWNWFDFLIVVFSTLSLFGHLFEHPEFLVVSRLFRVLRVMRLLEVSEDLKAVERKIVSIIPTIFSFALLLGILLYIYSIIGIYLFSHHQFAHADFSTLSHAFLTLFQLMTLDSWSDMMQEASATEIGWKSWAIKGYFVSFVVLTAIISFNVFVAVLTSQVHEKFVEDQEREEEEIKALLREVRELRKEVGDLKKS